MIIYLLLIAISIFSFLAFVAAVAAAIFGYLNWKGLKPMADKQQEILDEEKEILQEEQDQTTLITGAIANNDANLKKIADLEAQLAAGTPDLDALKAGLDQIKSGLTANNASLGKLAPAPATV